MGEGFSFVLGFHSPSTGLEEVVRNWGEGTTRVEESRRWIGHKKINGFLWKSL